MKFRWLATIGVVAVLMATTTPVTTNGHKIFEKAMEKSFEDVGINASCVLCHVAKEEKTVRNEFGNLFAKEFEGKNFSENWNKMERAEQKVYEKEHMTPAFHAAWEKIKKMKGKDDQTYETLIREFKMDGVKAKKKKK